MTEISMSHVIEDYVTTCYISRHNQLKLLLMKLYCYQKYQIINQQYILTVISTITITLTYLPIFLTFIALNLIKINEKLCIIERYLCHDKEVYVI